MFSKEEERLLVVSKYETMLKDNQHLFFDRYEFEDIIIYYLENAKFAKAKQAIEISLSQHPSANELRLLQAEMFIYEDNLTQAGEILDDVISLEPYNSEVYIQRANLYSKKNNHHKAIELLKYASSLTEDLSDIYSLIAMEYMYMEDYAMAKVYFQQCLTETPEDYFSLQQLLHCYDFLQEHTQAIDFLTNYINKNPYCEVAWHNLGRQYIAQNDLEEALRCFDFAIISDDTFTGAYFEKGKVLERLKRYKEAIENYKITLTLDDPSSFAYLRIGNCYEKMGKSASAEQYYFKAVHEDPQSSKAWLALVDYYARENDFEKAVKYVSKVLINEGDDPTFLCRCAEIYTLVGQYDNAIQTYEQAIDLGEFSAQMRNDFTDVLLLKELYEKAISVALVTLHTYPAEINTHYRIAIAYFYLNNTEKMLHHLKMAITLAPEWIAYFDKKYPAVFSDKEVKKILQKN
ncbi:MAG: tetratricopeptide repeat protein [Capnocytophaga sp.]|nr:tetratricopeptide repeat protein [Capnocytophaga sp.]